MSPRTALMSPSQCGGLHHAGLEWRTLQTAASHWGTVATAGLHCAALETAELQCRTLENAASHCGTLQTTISRCSTLQSGTLQCGTLHTAASQCKTQETGGLQRSTLQTTALQCGTLQTVASKCGARRIAYMLPAGSASNVNLAMGPGETCVLTATSRQPVGMAQGTGMPPPGGGQAVLIQIVGNPPVAALAVQFGGVLMQGQPAARVAASKQARGQVQLRVAIAAPQVPAAMAPLQVMPQEEQQPKRRTPVSAPLNPMQQMPQMQRALAPTMMQPSAQ